MNRTFRSFAWALLGTLLLVRGIPAHAACEPANVQLGPAAGTAVGRAPTGCVTGDFNADGILDIAIAVSHFTSGTVAGEIAVRLGHGSGGVGDGTFAAPIAYPAGLSPFAIVTGDFTGDGILDLIVTSVGSNTLRLLPGLGAAGVGNGGFGGPVTFAAGATAPHHLVTADFNHDGILDLAVAINSGPSMSVLLGQGTGGIANGTFAFPVLYPVASAGTGIAVADINEDGILDIAVTEYGAGSIGILLGNGTGGIGTGTFQSPIHVVTGPSPYDVVVADATGDGHADLLVGRDSYGGLWLYAGHGTAAFDAAVPLSTGGSSDPGVVADFDGDGLADVAFATSTANRVTLLHGMGGGAFKLRIQRPVAVFPVFMASGDFNADGARDIVVSSYLGDTSSVLLSSCEALPTIFIVDRVRDVPNDQGGKVWLTWPQHLLDVPGGSVANYRVWRRIPAASAAARPASAVRVTGSASGPVYWEAAAVLPAQGLPAYGYTAATAQDSLSGSNPYTAFFISAVSSSGVVFEDTPVDSGYSVDNLSPNAPAMVQGQVVGGNVVLGWAPNAEPDLYGYRVHRGADRFFTPGVANLVGQPTGTGFTDASGGPGLYYKVAAVDVHGNVGPFVLVEPSAATGIEVGLVSYEATPDGVTLTWYADAHAIPFATLERYVEGGAWEAIASASPDGGGQLVFHDADVVPGGTYAYRLAWTTPTGNRTSPVSTVTVPGLALALRGATPNPSHATTLAIRFTLTDGSAATLSLYDVSGRRVVRREVGSLGAGPHTLELGGARLSPGLYLARLAQHGQLRTARIVLAP